METNAALLNKSEIQNLLRLEDKLHKVAATYNLTLKSTPAECYAFLAQGPAELLSKVTNEIARLIQTFEVCAVEDVNPWNDQEFFTISMRRMGLTYAGDFLDHVRDEDLVEGYDLHRFQIFRNLRFMERSSYSLVEVLSFEWPVLYERSSAITNQLMSYCDEILWQANRTIRFDIPLHYIRELRSVERQVLEVEFKYLSPLFSGPNQPFGILASCNANPIDVTNPIDKLSFV